MTSRHSDFIFQRKCPYCTATFGIEGIECVRYTEHVLRCASNLNPDNIDRAIRQIAAGYPLRYPIRDMDPKDQQTILALQSIPRKHSESSMSAYTIPPLTEPLDPNWKQPSWGALDAILITDFYAKMNQATFDALTECSDETQPTLEHQGIVWKRKGSNEKWMLLWVQPQQMFSFREIVLI